MKFALPGLFVLADIVLAIGNIDLYLCKFVHPPLFGRTTYGKTMSLSQALAYGSYKNQNNSECQLQVPTNNAGHSQYLKYFAQDDCGFRCLCPTVDPKMTLFENSLCGIERCSVYLKIAIYDGKDQCLAHLRQCHPWMLAEDYKEETSTGRVQSILNHYAPRMIEQSAEKMNLLTKAYMTTKEIPANIESNLAGILRHIDEVVDANAISNEPSSYLCSSESEMLANIDTMYSNQLQSPFHTESEVQVRESEANMEIGNLGNLNRKSATKAKPRTVKKNRITNVTSAVKKGVTKNRSGKTGLVALIAQMCDNIVKGPFSDVQSDGTTSDDRDVPASNDIAIPPGSQPSGSLFGIPPRLDCVHSHVNGVYFNDRDLAVWPSGHGETTTARGRPVEHVPLETDIRTDPPPIIHKYDNIVERTVFEIQAGETVSSSDRDLSAVNDVIIHPGSQCGPLFGVPSNASPKLDVDSFAVPSQSPQNDPTTDSGIGAMELINNEWYEEQDVKPDVVAPHVMEMPNSPISPINEVPMISSTNTARFKTPYPPSRLKSRARVNDLYFNRNPGVWPVGYGETTTVRGRPVEHIPLEMEIPTVRPSILDELYDRHSGDGPREQSATVSDASHSTSAPLMKYVGRYVRMSSRMDGDIWHRFQSALDSIRRDNQSPIQFAAVDVLQEIPNQRTGTLSDQLKPMICPLRKEVEREQYKRQFHLKCMKRQFQNINRSSYIGVLAKAARETGLFRTPSRKYLLQRIGYHEFKMNALTSQWSAFCSYNDKITKVLETLLGINTIINTKLNEDTGSSTQDNS